MLRRPNRQSTDHAFFTKARFVTIAIVGMLALLTIDPRAFAQTQQCPYVTCGDGSDLAYNPTTSGYFMPGNFHGTRVANNVFNFTSVTIPAGVTITFSSGYDNAPVYWLVQGNVDVEGTLSLNGANGVASALAPGERSGAAGTPAVGRTLAGCRIASYSAVVPAGAAKRRKPLVDVRCLVGATSFRTATCITSGTWSAAIPIS